VIRFALMWFPANVQWVASENTFEIGAKPAATIPHEIAGPWTGNEIVDFLAHQNGSLFRPTWNEKAEAIKPPLSNVI